MKDFGHSYTCFLFYISLALTLNGCDDEIEPPDRRSILTSKVWGETNYEITDPSIYTCVFEPSGKYYTTNKGYETFSGQWQLLGDRTLKIDQWEVQITQLTSKVLEYKGDATLLGFTYKTTYHLQALEGIVAITTGVSDISEISAKLHGVVRSGDALDIFFDYGPTVSYGSVLPVLRSSGAIHKNVEIDIANLNPGTTYHYRLKVMNGSSVLYGQDKTFRTCNDQSVVDADNNSYRTITVGNQVWMAENLRTTKFNDGTPIISVKDEEAWAIAVGPAYCWKDNDSLTHHHEGAIYNWYTVATGKLCPSGWHIPSLRDWNTLVTFVSGTGSSLIENCPNCGDDWREASNETGFSGSFSGTRSSEGYFGQSDCWLWLSTEFNSEEARHLMIYPRATSDYYRSKKFGLPVRCIKD